MGRRPTRRQIELEKKGFKSKVGSPYTIREAITDILNEYIVELDSGEEYWYDSDEDKWMYYDPDEDKEDEIAASEFMEMLLSDFDK